MYRMRGTTKQLRELGTGETIRLTSARDNIYKFARAVGIRVTVIKVINGFEVTKIGDKNQGEMPYIVQEVAEAPLPNVDEDFDFGA